MQMHVVFQERSHNDGMTLIELLLVMLIIGIIVGAGAQMLRNVVVPYFTARDIVEAEWQGQIAAARLSREMRAAIDSGLTTSASTVV